MFKFIRSRRSLHLFKSRRFLFAACVGLLFFQFQNCGETFKSDHSSWRSFGHSEGVVIPHHDNGESLDEEMVAKIQTTFEPILADRELVSNLLVDIFGVQAKRFLIGDIQRSRASFGSPCSVYDNYFYRKLDSVVEADPGNQCANDQSPEFMGAPTNPSASGIRQANLTRVCASLVSNSETLENVLVKISRNANLERLPTPSIENIQRMITLFYRGKPVPGVPVIQSLQVMINPDQPGLVEWQSALFTVCASSQWQVL